MDIDEFKARFLPLSKPLYWVAWRLTTNQADAEDLVQETMMRLWQIRNRLTNIENDTAFSTRMLHNIFIDSYRRQHATLTDSSPEEMSLASNEDATQRIEQVEEACIIHQLIARLNEPGRSIIRMRDMENRTYEEITQKTGLNEAHVRVLLSRARKKIREQFNTICHYEQTQHTATA